MKRLLIIIPFCILILFGCKNSADYWAKPFSADKESWSQKVIRTDDGIFSALNVGDKNGANCLPLMMNLNFSGQTNWIKSYSHSNYAMVTCMCESNNDIFFSGKSYWQGKNIMFIIKIDNTGNKLWEKYFEAPKFMITPKDITEVDSKTVMLTGSITGLEKDIKNLFVLRLLQNSVNNYDVDWFKSYDSEYSKSDSSIAYAKEEGISIEHAYGGLCLVGGNIYTPTYKHDPWFITIESNGMIANQSRLKNGGSNTFITSMRRTTPAAQLSKYVVSGSSDIKGTADMLALSLGLKTNPTVELNRWFLYIYEPYAGGSDYAFDIDMVIDGNCILVGSYYSSVTASTDASLIKLNGSTGEVIWSNSYGNVVNVGNYTDRFYSVVRGPYVDFIVGGSTNTFPQQTLKNAWVMNLDKDGKVDLKTWNDKCMFMGFDVKAHIVDWNWGCLPGLIQVLINDINYNILEIYSDAEDVEMESLYLCDEL